MKFVVLLVVLWTHAMAQDVLTIDKDAWVAAHNKLRAQEPASNMQDMVWSDDLAQLAAKWAPGCKFDHSPKDMRKNVGKFSYVGENLAVRQGSGDPEATEVVTDWYSEKSDYTYESNKCTPGKMCGHYTQVVWAKSNSVGCAVAKCAKLDMADDEGSVWDDAYHVVCNYGPGGNWNGEKPYIVGKKGEAGAEETPSGEEPSIEEPSDEEPSIDTPSEEQPKPVPTAGGSEGSAAWLTAHNKLRGQEPASDMEAMVWNEDLAKLAAEWAKGCVFDHRPKEQRGGVGSFEYVGENLAVSQGDSAPTAAFTVNDWYSEKKDYDFESNTCSNMCGHYTQVVWAKSTAVGCAVHLCEKLDMADGDFWDNAYLSVCNYGPGGNMNDERPYTVAA